MTATEFRVRVQSIVGQPVLQLESIAGGCIGNAVRVQTETGSYFAKWGQGEVADTLAAEALGLATLASSAKIIRIPEVVGREAYEDGSTILALEWIDTAGPTDASWKRFGAGLAEIHGRTASSYGFETDNFIGATPQKNGWVSSWPAFFRDRRLQYQAGLARSRGLWRAGWDKHLERLGSRLPELLPADPPASLLHGDMWRGNVLFDDDGRPVLIDPAVYHGHAEADLAMSGLFGALPGRFLDAYDSLRPPEAGRDDRAEIYNLYHLINHLNLFGASYAPSVERVLKHY